MEAVILCGGRGTRLHEETVVRPKPMVTVGDHPILWHIMSHYRAYGLRDFVLCLGYKGDVIRDYFVNYHQNNADIEVDLSSGDIEVLSRKAIDWRVRLVDTGLNAYTGARIRRIARHIRSDRFFATYGDGLSDIDLDKLLRFHRLCHDLLHLGGDLGRYALCARLVVVGDQVCDLGRQHCLEPLGNVLGVGQVH